MKRRLLAVFNDCSSSVTALTGCSKSNSSNENIVTELQEPVTIEMWHYMTGKQAETLQKIVEDFNSTNDKGITVKLLHKVVLLILNKKVIAVLNQILYQL